MIKAGNYSFATDRITGKIIKEQDSYTCFHCQRVVMVQPRQKGEDVGGYCGVCKKLICPVCVGKGSCNPWQEQMAKIEARERFLRSAGL